MSFRSFLLLILLLNYTQCANILAIFNAPSKSNIILGVKLAEGLIKRGHHVTMASPFVSDPVDGLTQLHLKTIYDYREKLYRANAITTMNPFNIVKIMIQYWTEVSDLFWEEPAIQKIIEEKPKFDVVITFSVFTDAISGLAYHLGVPSIFFSPVGSNNLVNYYVANPNMVYVPNMMFPATSNTFLARLYTVTANIGMHLMAEFFITPYQRDLLKKYLPDCPSLEDLQKNVSLMLMNSHFSIESPRPHVPNAIQIGGFHLDQTKELPEDIKNFLDSAKQGAILFSMGTNVNVAIFGEEKLKAIFKVLGELAPMRVLFKSEMEHKNAPDNVMVKKWLPQADILAHPNMRAFISHGGLGGNTESVYHGVPMVGIPFYGDQRMNIQVAKSAGYAVGLDYEHLTEDLFRSKINEILENPRYGENAKKRSALIKGQLIKPMDNAAFWIEHIIKYGSGSHLRNDGMDLSWYQLYMVDIYLFYTVFLCLISFITYKTMKVSYRFLRRICSKNPVKQKKS
ncbi:hypothetical protein WA026_006280 [Henosepilachna vigintioctopunctata]|uniref:UDP-glucuronosyltransferase n=1 Tax=Henosepilachna vigintioctopunctata TaxID=420089 RepID=A0AAW1TQZ0_9CUCU